AFGIALNHANTWSALQTLSSGLTVSGGTITLPATSIANAALQGSGALTVTAGTGLAGGGSVVLGSSTTVSLDLTANDTWTGAHINAPSSATAVALILKGSAT